MLGMTNAVERTSPRARASTSIGITAEEEVHKLPSQNKVVRNKVSPADKLNKRHEIHSTQQTARYVKPNHGLNTPSTSGSDVTSPWSYVPDPYSARSPCQEIGIDQPFPTTPEGSFGGAMIPQHLRTPSDDRVPFRAYESPLRGNCITPPIHRSSPHHVPVQPSLSTVVPPPPGHDSSPSPYQILSGRTAPFSDSQVHCAPRTVTNSPYITMTPRYATNCITNHQYIQCPQRKPERPATLNLMNAHTPESSGIRSLSDHMVPSVREAAQHFLICRQPIMSH
uniref:Uncharacterized protein n=1 Tax=Heterorhabditis bacteriophora TaxID=37862 RepID=A0A1I7XGI1_HETBA